MKQIIEFQLPDEQEEFELYLKAPKYHSVLWEFEQLLRSMTKYNTHPTEERELNKVESNLIQQIRDKFYELYREQDLIL